MAVYISSKFIDYVYKMAKEAEDHLQGLIEKVLGKAAGVRREGEEVRRASRNNDRAEVKKVRDDCLEILNKQTKRVVRVLSDPRSKALGGGLPSLREGVARWIDEAKAVVSTVLNWEQQREEEAKHHAEKGEDSPLVRAIQEFNEALAEAERYAETAGLKIPWQVRYAAERNNEGSVEFEGGVIVDREGKPIWESRCCYCAIVIEHGSFGQGTIRYHCQECARIDRCEDCNKLHLQLRSILFKTAKKYEGMERLHKEVMDAVKQMEEYDPHFYHPLTPEKLHPVWQYLEVSAARSPAGLMWNAIRTYENRLCVGTRKRQQDATSDYEWLTYKEVGHRARVLASFLRTVLPPQSVIGICSVNRNEWIITDFACAFNNYIPIGIHTTYATPQLHGVLEAARPTYIFCSIDMLDRFVEATEKYDFIQRIVVYDDVSIAAVVKNDMQARICKFSDLLRGKDILGNLTGEDIDNYTLQKTEDPNFLNGSLFTVMYTSGSTGTPKGVMITKEGMRYDIGHPLYVWPLVTVSYIPLSHSTDRLRVWEGLVNGGRVGFANYHPRNWAEHESGEKKRGLLWTEGSTNGVEELIADVRLLRPTIFIAPPRIWDGLRQIYSALVQSPSSSGVPPEELERKARAEVVQSLGGRVIHLATGGSPTSAATMAFVSATFKDCAFDESYGATECGGITMNGKQMEGVQMRLVDLPELGYTNEDKPFPRGEIAVKSPVVSPGYFRQPSETAESFHDGWFFTGDLGELDTAAGILKIIGRKKNVGRVLGGRTFDPDSLEMFYTDVCPFIDQICIIADETKEFLIAVIVPNGKGKQKKEGDRTALLLEEMVKAGKEQNMADWKVVRGIILEEEEEWSPDNGLLTPSFKVLRKNITSRYNRQIVALYERLTPQKE